MITQELVGTIAALIGLVSPVLLFLWKTLKGVKKFVSDQEVIKKSINDIKAEVTQNGGKSIKDVVNSLKSTAERIETRQKVLDQRSKAALHYTERPLFETDKSGKLIWSNEAFQKLTRENGVLEGHDWLAMIHEDEREAFISEVKSCLRMCRKIVIETESVNGNKISFLGYPYKTGSDTHEGFLIHVYTGENK